MSDEQSALQAGLALVSGVMKEIVNESQEIMKIHPINSLIMLNLFGNLGYALLNEAATDAQGRAYYKYGGANYFSRQDVIAEVFRDSAEKTGALLTTEAVSQIFSFKLDLGKVAAALGGIP